ncbi:MAG: phosphoenolpyruvate carboxykinase (ATP) [bacterium]|nr:phosphoenolpyruvate carboxykinase (ATP) [bacterium]MCP4801068.1 phosphoenolpyruvate carboxykinase (ATP) [bacterium]
MSFKERVDELLLGSSIKRNISRSDLIQASVDNGEAVVSKNGALATWTKPDSTGRSPKDTLIVKRPESADTIDWTAANNIPVDPETFDMLVDDALENLGKSANVYASDRVIGADATYALPVTTVSNKALNVLFCDNMFRETPEGVENSIFADRPFTLLVCPDQKLDAARYEGRLRIDDRIDGTSTMVIAVDFDRRVGVVYGSQYCGSCKKMLFTVMNYMLPVEGILPIHCSANEGPDGDIALLLGLSGTGKTTLSAVAERGLLGDDEHGWNDNGVANFENGCYAKLIDLDPNKEPEIFKACFQEKPYLEHGAIIENALMWADGSFDLYDDRLTPNSRGSYPLEYLTNINETSTGDHPNVILFLTADANGVLPPVSKLTKEQAMLWFIMGYTSKLAGTETGVTEPKSAFSRFFGAPFMPRNPDEYADLLGKKLDEHDTQVYLVNTGWSGGPYGVGSRMDIMLTRSMVAAAIDGSLKDVEYKQDETFKVWVPQSCPGVEDESILNAINTWEDKAAYGERAAKLAQDFAAQWNKAYADKDIDAAIAAECPGL